MAALRAAVFPLSAKNRRGGHFLPPRPVRVLNQFFSQKNKPIHLVIRAVMKNVIRFDS